MRAPTDAVLTKEHWRFQTCRDRSADFFAQLIVASDASNADALFHHEYNHKSSGAAGKHGPIRTRSDFCKTSARSQSKGALPLQGHVF